MTIPSNALPTTTTAEPTNRLRPNILGLPHAIVISVAVMSPAASIFFNTPPQAGVVGAAIPFCYVIGFIVALFVANQFSELARELPSSGSAYTFVTAGLGQRWGFLVGWVGMLAIALGVPYSFVFMSANLSELINRWFGINLDWPVFYVLAIGIVFAIAYTGVRASLRLDIGFVIFEVGICLALAGIIFWHVGRSGGLTASPFTPSGIPASGSLAVGIIFSVLSFIGFETAATLGEETRNPRRNIPRAVFGSMIVIGIFYIIMVYAATLGYGINNMVTGYANDAAPFDTLGRHYGGGMLTVLIDIVGVLGFFSAALAIVNGGARIVYAIARDKLLPGFLARTHSRRQTPGAAIATLCAFGLVSGIPLGLALTPINAFAFLAVTDATLTLIIYFAVNLACLRFFRTQRRAQFQILTHGMLPVIGMLITGAILAALVASPGNAPLSFAPALVGIWCVIGVIVAFILKMPPNSPLATAEDHPTLP